MNASGSGLARTKFEAIDLRRRARSFLALWDVKEVFVDMIDNDKRKYQKFCTRVNSLIN